MLYNQPVRANRTRPTLQRLVIPGEPSDDSEHADVQRSLCQDAHLQDARATAGCVQGAAAAPLLAQVERHALHGYEHRRCNKDTAYAPAGSCILVSAKRFSFGRLLQAEGSQATTSAQLIADAMRAAYSHIQHDTAGPGATHLTGGKLFAAHAREIGYHL